MRFGLMLYSYGNSIYFGFVGELVEDGLRMGLKFDLFNYLAACWPANGDETLSLKLSLLFTLSSLIALNY